MGGSNDDGAREADQASGAGAEPASGSADPTAATLLEAGAGTSPPRAASAAGAGERIARGGAAPSRIGRYEIVRLLGEGAMGRVFLARDPELHRRVAIKTVREDLPLPADAREQFLTRFRNEARAAARVAHPGIVAVHDVGDDPAVGPFLVLEYIEGATLQERLASGGPLAPPDAVRLFDRIAAAIDAAHASGIVHRDIKPQNVLVTAEGEGKLTDFGVARIPDAQLTREGQFLGTPCYAAPETLQDQAYSPASDLFSFGTLVYEALTGKRAFPGEDAVAVARKVIDDEPQPPSKARRGVPATLDPVLARAMAKARSDRYRSATELAAALRKAFERAGATLPGVGPSVPSSGGGTMAFAAVLFGALLVGGAIVLSLEREPPPSGTVAAPSSQAVPDAATDSGADARVEVAANSRDAGRGRMTPSSAAAGNPDGPGGAGDASAAAVATARPDASGLSRQEREDLAKDELDRARARLREGDLDAARAALARARALDPTHPDIAVLEASVRTEDDSTEP